MTEPMKVYYDCEFLEDGKTIELISIGMVTDDGREYYAVNLDAPWRRIKKHEWLMANVVPYLPRGFGEARQHWPKHQLVDINDERVKARRVIAAEVSRFLLGDDPHDVPDLQLWAWYGAYDHVALCQLWGRMIDLPRGIPMWTNDLRQEVQRLGDPRMPEQESGAHNALADARHVKAMAEHLAGGVL
jgi:3'-5' exoribonuclease-like protein